MKALVIFVSLLLCPPALGSYLGAVHSLGDSLAVFRVPELVLFAVVVIWAPWSQWVRCPVEGNSIRATSRIADVSKNTVTKLLEDSGKACAKFHDEKRARR